MDQNDLVFRWKNIKKGKGVFVQKLQPLRAGTELRNYRSSSLIILGIGETSHMGAQCPRGL